MNHPVKECIQKLGLTHRAFVINIKSHAIFMAKL
ncbi:hypothetical protein DFP97_107110 [Paenibacillus prosopidis]|uniref:Uncharacterized protein n=1 Tax=Paenibacillus prosopidis TaxID=630520 RepID=A0A368W0C2_9BACL|nr:hypothetical protein DFP97_107110 [Paenibacillus prosopidis]